MKFEIKRVLLAGTALVAVSMISVQAQAANGADGSQVAANSTVTADTTGVVGDVGGADATGDNGGDGIELITATDILLNISSAAITGGAGGAGGPATGVGQIGGVGGHGINTETQDGTATTDNHDININATSTVTGGAGGAGSDATAADGGAGGAAGHGINLDSNFGDVASSGAITGGAGGVGGAGQGGGDTGGIGGAGGIGALAVGTDTILTFNAGTVTGGVGGAGGTGATQGDGGAGGIAISVTGADATVFIDNDVTVTGGAGGAGDTAGTAGIGLSITGTGATVENEGTIISGGAGAVTSVLIDTGGTTTSFFNDGGTIGGAGAGIGVDIDAGDTVTSFDNTAGTIQSATGTALNVDGVITTLDNTNGAIQTTGDASALVIGAAGDIDAFTNTGGTVTSLSTGNGTVDIQNDLGAGGLTITGGTFSNTAGNNTDNVFNFGTADQAGTLTLTGVTVVNDGAGAAASGDGVAFDLNGQDATIVIDSTSSVTGQFLSTAGGLLDLTTSGTLIGDITTAGEDDVLTISAGTITGDIELGAGTNVLNVNGTFGTAGTIAATAGTIDTTVGAAGAFTVNNAFTDGGTLATTAGGTMTLSGADATFAGAVTNNGTIVIKDGRTLTSASYVTGSTGTMNFELNNTAAGGGVIESGAIFATGGTSDFTNGTVEFLVAPGSLALENGDTFTFVTDAGGVSTAFGTITDNSFLNDYAITNVGNDLRVTVTVANTAVGAATAGNNSTAATLLTVTLAATVDTELNLAQANVNNAASAAALNEVLESVLPTVDGSAVTASLTTMGHTMNLSGTRLASLRGAPTGMAAGSMYTAGSTWGQVFGGISNQDARDNIDGYDAVTGGFAFGMDSGTSRDGVVGVSVTYGYTNADSENATTTETEVHSIQAALYGEYDIDEDTYFSGALAYGFNMNESTRNNVGGVPGLTANGDYDAHQFSVQTKVGRDYRGHNSGMGVSPSLLLNYTHLNTQSYTETGAGGLNLSIDTDSLNILEVGAGVDVSWKSGYWSPTMHASYRYDIIGDEVNANSTFAAGGAAFSSKGFDAGQHKINTGFGATYTIDNMDVSMGYDLEWKPDYLGHSGSLRTTFRF